MKLLLIDNRVNDIGTVISSLLPDTEYVMFDYQSDTLDSLSNKIGEKQYERVGIFQENYETSTYQFVSSFEPAVLSNVSLLEPNLITWTKYLELINYFKNTLGMVNLDLIGCNIGSNADWKYVENYLENTLQITVNSSIDLTDDRHYLELLSVKQINLDNTCGALISKDQIIRIENLNGDELYQFDSNPFSNGQVKKY